MKAQLHSGRNLVDVLTTGTRRADKALLQIVLVDRQAVGDTDDRAAFFHEDE